MNALPESNRSKHRQLYAAILATAVQSIYVYITLIVTDKILLHVITGYHSPGSYEFGVAIFFVASSLYLYVVRNQSWSRISPFLMTAIALFFPLVVFSSILRIKAGLPEDLHNFYASNFCPPETGETLCGQALAHVVFCMTVRALPLVVTVPLLYRVIFKLLHSKPVESTAHGT